MKLRLNRRVRICGAHWLYEIIGLLTFHAVQEVGAGHPIEENGDVYVKKEVFVNDSNKLNLYLFVANQSINFNDSLGLYTFVDCQEAKWNSCDCISKKQRFPTQIDMEKMIKHYIKDNKLRDAMLNKLKTVKITCRNKETRTCKAVPPPLAYAGKDISICMANTCKCSPRGFALIFIHELAHTLGMPAESNGLMNSEWVQKGVPGNGGYECTNK